MKIISTKVHGLLDYLTGFLLIVCPWLLDFADGTAAQNIPVVIGIMTIVMSFCTNYEWGFIKLVSMKTHLAMDMLSGIFLAASPWLFNFSETVYIPHLILGIFNILGSLVTHRVPGVKAVGNAHTRPWPAH